MPPELAHDFPARTGLPVTHVASLFKIAWLRDQGLSLRRPAVALAARVRHRPPRRAPGRRAVADGAHRLPRHPHQRPLPPGPGAPRRRRGPACPSSSAPAPRPGGCAPTTRWSRPAAPCSPSPATTTPSPPPQRAPPPRHPPWTASAPRRRSSSPAATCPTPTSCASLTAHGVSVYPHVVHGTTGLLAGMRTGLVLKRVLRLLGADDEDGRSRVDRESLAHRGDRSGDIARLRLLDVGPRRHRAPARRLPDPGKGLARGAGPQHRARRQPALAPRHRRGSHRATRPRGWLEPDAVGPRRAPRPRPHGRGRRHPAAGPRGAALYGRWAATQGDSISSDLRPPAAYFTPVAETVSAGHAPPLAKEATP